MWLQYSTRELRWFQHFKIAFGKTPNVLIRTAYIEVVTYVVSPSQCCVVHYILSTQTSCPLSTTALRMECHVWNEFMGFHQIQTSYFIYSPTQTSWYITESYDVHVHNKEHNSHTNGNWSDAWCGKNFLKGWISLY